MPLTQPPMVEGPGTDELFARLAARHKWQLAHIEYLSAVRNYNVKNDKSKTLATETVFVEYRAPHTVTFTTRFGKGSQYIRRHVFQKLMQFEADKIHVGNDQGSLIAPQNYTLQLVGKDKIGNSECLIVRATPRRKERDLFQGTIWIDNRSFAIIKIAGDLVKNPSFWVKHVHFVREYVQIGEFWLPLREQAVSLIRLFGQETLTVNYSDYSINGTSDGSISLDRSPTFASRSGR